MMSTFSMNMENIAVGPSITISTQDHRRTDGTCCNPHSFTNTFDQWRAFSSHFYFGDSQQNSTSEWEWTRGLKLFQVNEHRQSTSKFLPQSYRNENFSLEEMYLPQSTQHNADTASIVSDAFSDDAINTQPSSLFNSEEHTLATPSEDLRYRNQLKNHSSTHMSESSFKCTLCGLSFLLQSDFLQHQCDASRPFECPRCHSRFKQKLGLKRHIRIHTGERPFKCAVCSKAFTQKCHLSRHERIHTGERPFKCAVCSKAFTQKYALSRHERIHTGERPFKCAVCSKAFTQKCVLSRHERIHTGERPFKCAICGRRFAQKRSLSRHEDSRICQRLFK